MPESHDCLSCGHRWLDGAPGSPAACPQCGRPEGEASPILRSLLRRLDQIETRLGKLEGAGAPVLQARLVEPDVKPEPAAVLPPQAKSIEPRPAHRPTLEEIFKPKPMASAAPAPPRMRPTPKPKAMPADAGLERKIGLQWAAWIGALVLVAGVGLGIKFALDQGWLRFLTPEIRLALMSLGGFALLGAGEYVYRRANPLGSVGLFGAGIGVLFFVGFAGNLFFELYSANVAFAFTAATALIGSGVALRSRFVAVGVLAQLGANLAPILLSTGQRPDVVFFGYLYLLQVFALLLCWWGAGPKWWTVRLLSLATTFLWILASLATRGAELGLQDELLWFTLLATATFHAEFVRSSLQYEVVGAGEAGVLRRLKQTGGVYLLVVTLLGVYVSLQLLQPETANVRGLFLAGLAATAAGVGLLLWRTGLQAPGALAWGYGLQTIVLLVLVIPVTQEGPWISIGWALLACAFAVWGSWQAYGPARWAGAATWALAVASLGYAVVNEEQPQRLRDAWLMLLEAPLPAWLLIAWLEAAGGLLVAGLLQTMRLNRREPPGRPILLLSRSLVWLAALLAVVVAAAGLPSLGSTATALLAAGVVWLLRPQAPRLRLFGVALALLVFAVGKWLTWDTLDELRLMEAEPLLRWPVANRYLGVGLAVAVGFTLFLWRQRRRFELLFARTGKAKRGTASSGAGLLAVVLLLFATLTVGLSVETNRGLLRLHAAGWADPWAGGQELALALVVLWSALGVLLAETLRRLKLPTLAAWGMLGSAAIAWLVLGSLLPYLRGPSPTVPLLLNLQGGSALALAAALFWLNRRTPLAWPHAWLARSVQQLLTLALLAAGTLEVDRAVSASLSPGLPQLAQQAGVSVWWSLFALGAVAFGFWRRLAWLRYFGLGLFALTLVKVGLVDLRGVSYGYRVISLIVLGLLLIGTSVLYGFLSPRLLDLAPGKTEGEAAEPPAVGVKDGDEPTAS